MSEKDIQGFVKGLGGICEIAGLMRDELIRCGFSRDEAIYIVSKYIVHLLTPNFNTKEEE